MKKYKSLILLSTLLALTSCGPTSSSSTSSSKESTPVSSTTPSSTPTSSKDSTPSASESKSSSEDSKAESESSVDSISSESDISSDTSIDIISSETSSESGSSESSSASSSSESSSEQRSSDQTSSDASSSSTSSEASSSDTSSDSSSSESSSGDSSSQDSSSQDSKVGFELNPTLDMTSEASIVTENSTLSKGVYTFNNDFTINGFTFINGSKNWLLDTSKKTIEGQEFSGRLKSGGKGTKAERAISFVAESAGSLTVYGSSTGDAKIVTCVVENADSTVEKVSNSITGTPAAYTFAVSAGTNYFYPSDNNLYVWYLKFTPAA